MTQLPSSWRSQLEERGYIVVPEVVPAENLRAVVADMWQHTGVDPHDRASWYRRDTIGHAGMVEMYHYQSMWNNRQHPQVHAVFSDLFGTEQLWVSLDRVNFKPPADPQQAMPGDKGFIHWDVDIHRYPAIPFNVQGVLALTDTDATMGGFQCVPELYQNLAAWLAQRRIDGTPLSRQPDLTGYSITQVPLHAGDMVIWSTLLPHGNGQNVSDRPRLAQYITMFLARPDDEQARLGRINCWQHNLPAPGKAFPGDTRKVEEQRTAPATLTALGRKLLGVDRWE